jgi:hypothetical protein
MALPSDTLTAAALHPEVRRFFLLGAGAEATAPCKGLTRALQSSRPGAAHQAHQAQEARSASSIASAVASSDSRIEAWRLR